MKLNKRSEMDDLKEQTSKIVSKLIDEYPEWESWLVHQLELLDTQYNPHFWIEMESIR